jgi:tetratricopeptide (TPR) repeat protein
MQGTVLLTSRAQVFDMLGIARPLHRLVQEVARDTMDDTARRAWAERVIAAVHAAFPSVEYQNWAQCERLLPHAQVVAQRIVENDFVTGTAAQLLSETACYLFQRGRYVEAQPLYERVVAMCERLLVPNHPDVSTSLNNLAVLYGRQGRYAEALPLSERALAISEREFGDEFIEGVGIVAKAFAEFAREAVCSAAPVTIMPISA